MPAAPGLDQDAVGERRVTDPTNSTNDTRRLEELLLLYDAALGEQHEMLQQERAARARRPRRPTLASVSKQANKAAIPVARYEFKPDGTIVAVTGKSESAESNPWLADLKVTKQ